MKDRKCPECETSFDEVPFVPCETHLRYDSTNNTKIQMGLEDVVGLVESLMQDVQRNLTRAALKGSLRGERKQDMIHKLKWVIDKLERYDG